jgi:hypothetical protein
MAQDRLEECLQAVVGGEKSGAIKRGGWMRFLKGKISERIQQRPSDSRDKVSQEWSTTALNGAI